MTPESVAAREAQRKKLGKRRPADASHG
jgi:hypothetical protein